MVQVCSQPLMNLLALRKVEDVTHKASCRSVETLFKNGILPLEN